MEMRGDKGYPTGRLGRQLVFGSYAAKAFAEPLGLAVLGRAFVVPAIAGGLPLWERRSAVSAQ